MNYSCSTEDCKCSQVKNLRHPLMHAGNPANILLTLGDATKVWEP
jgi:hypothetical protein